MNSNSSKLTFIFKKTTSELPKNAYGKDRDPKAYRDENCTEMGIINQSRSKTEFYALRTTEFISNKKPKEGISM